MRANQNSDFKTIFRKGLIRFSFIKVLLIYVFRNINNINLFFQDQDNCVTLFYFRGFIFFLNTIHLSCFFVFGFYFEFSSTQSLMSGVTTPSTQPQRHTLSSSYTTINIWKHVLNQLQGNLAIHPLPPKHHKVIRLQFTEHVTFIYGLHHVYVTSTSRLRHVCVIFPESIRKFVVGNLFIASAGDIPGVSDMWWLRLRTFWLPVCVKPSTTCISKLMQGNNIPRMSKVRRH